MKKRNDPSRVPGTPSSPYSYPNAPYSEGAGSSAEQPNPASPYAPPPYASEAQTTGPNHGQGQGQGQTYGQAQMQGWQADPRSAGSQGQAGGAPQGQYYPVQPPPPYIPTAPVEEKKKKRRKLMWYDYVIYATVVILLLLALYYFIEPVLVHRKQQEISNELLNMVPATVEEVQMDNSLKEFEVDPEANKVEGEAWEDFAQGEETYKAGQKVTLHPIGRLQIDSIELSYPILDKSGLVELRYGIGLYPESSPLFGEEGTSVLFGHHMIERGHYFNRLEEVKIGDEVRVVGNGKVYTYRVNKRLTMKPEAMFPLLSEKGQGKNLLMITCIGSNFEDRLLVYAQLEGVENLPQQQGK